jgi:hypothetical protein
MKLAIKGHSTRGKEVIELLEMMGGINPFINNGYVIGNKESHCYYISENATLKYISWDYIGPEEINEYRIFTIEEFEQKFPYKVGDKVKNTCGAYGKVYEMKWIDDEIQYRLDFGHHISGWYNVCELQPYKKETIEEININKIGFNSDKARLILPDGYEFKAEGNEVFIIKKKSKYPKTYEECCKIKQSDPNFYIDTHLYSNKLGLLYKLLICRDAYWKIAGEQMGLDKPWEPDFTDTKEMYYIFYKGYIEKGNQRHPNNHILIFPTPEMRDAFYENFKDLIEECKELL